MGNGTFQNASGVKGHFILWETGHSTFWERFFPQGIGSLIFWESDHLSSGNRTTYPLGFGTSSWTRDMGNGTRYPFGFGPNILWETDHLSSGIGPLILWDSGHPLGHGTWETEHAILLDSDHTSSGNREFER